MIIVDTAEVSSSQPAWLVESWNHPCVRGSTFFSFITSCTASSKDFPTTALFDGGLFALDDDLELKSDAVENLVGRGEGDAGQLLSV